MTVTAYHWDYASDTLLVERDESGFVRTVYTNEPQTFGTVLSQTDGSDTTFHHYDGLSSTRELTNAAGVETDSYTYTAFGVTSATSGTSPNPFRFQGAAGYYDDSPAVEALYSRRRYYGPPVGRWLSEDPLGIGEIGNLFVYASNNPLAFYDPSGLQSMPLLPFFGAGCSCCAVGANFTECRRWRGGDCGIRGRRFGCCTLGDLLS